MTSSKLNCMKIVKRKKSEYSRPNEFENSIFRLEIVQKWSATWKKREFVLIKKGKVKKRIEKKERQ